MANWINTFNVAGDGCVGLRRQCRVRTTRIHYLDPAAGFRYMLCALLRRGTISCIGLATIGHSITANKN
jgi:hypothetical protein